MPMTSIPVATASSDHLLTARIANDTLDLALAVLVVGLLIVLLEAWTAAQAKKKAAQHGAAAGGDTKELRLPGGIAEVIKDTGELAKGLAKVDLGTRVLLVGVVLIAIAGLTASAGDVSGAIGHHHGKTVINNNQSVPHGTKPTGH
jgi:hypothetical protein